MNNRIILMSCVLLGLIVQSDRACAQKNNRTKDKLINFNGFTLNGTAKFGVRSVVNICNSGFRYFDGQREFSLLCTSPKWEIYTVNFKKKIYMPLAQIKSKNQLVLLNANLKEAAGTWEKRTQTPQEKYLGHKVHSWILYSGDNPTSKVKAENYWVLQAMDELPIPPSLSRANSEMHGIPNIPYHPVYLAHILPGDRREIYLQALTIKPAKFKASDFAVPKGFKLATSEADLSLEMEGVTEFLDAISDPRLREK